VSPFETGPEAVLDHDLDISDQRRVERNVSFAPGARVVVCVGYEDAGEFTVSPYERTER